jgi:hypothetical protein
MKEKLMLIEKIKKIDPTKISPLAEGLNLENIKDEDGKDTKEYQDKETGEIFFKKHKHLAEIEHFVSLLSKGILHVSDFVKKDNEYFSHKMPLNQIEPSSNEDIETEVFLLHYLFGDWDHKIDSRKNKTGLSWEKNLRVGDNNQFVHFDYNMAMRKDDMSEPFDYGNKNYFLFQSQTKNFLNKKLQKKFNLKKFKFELKNNTIDKDKFLSVLTKKVQEYENVLNDSYFFDSIIKKSNLQIDNKKLFFYLKNENHQDRIEELREYLLNRVLILKTVILKNS